MFSSRCATELVPGISSIRSYRWSSHASATCETVAPRRSATAATEPLRAADERRAEREVRDERDLVLDAHVEHVLAGAVDDAVGVLHLADLRELEHAADRVRAGLADADQVELALAAEVFERAELLGQEVT